MPNNNNDDDDDDARFAALRRRLTLLYGASAADACLPRVLEVIERFRPAIAARRAPHPQRPHAVLIAYPDHLQRTGEAPLSTLTSWCRAHLPGAISAVHVLPFHPSTSYEGYAITDYVAVDERLGAWSDLDSLQRDFDLMVDLVLNHCSSSHPWFRQLLADEEPGRSRFIVVDDPAAPWLRAVWRARDLPLCTRVETRAGPKHVWTTYAPDLVDLDWSNPAVCVEFLAILLDNVARGARHVRLDAFGYVWKEPSTSCVNRPGGHVLIALFHDVLRAAGAGDTALLPSVTNVTQAQNRAYFGGDDDDDGRKADLVYLLPLAGLLLHTLYSHDTTVLARFLAAQPPPPAGCATLNLTASHDGVGLSWLADLLEPAQLRALIAAAVARGSLVSTRRRTVDDEDAPWELNTTWFSACAVDVDEAPALHVARFIATQSVVLALQGVPALYLPSLLAAPNDHERARASGDNRAINRARFALDDVDGDPLGVLGALGALLRARARAAFDPSTPQSVVDVGDARVLALLRSPPDGDDVLCLASFSATPLEIDRRHLGADFGGALRDVVTGALVGPRLRLPPYGVAWLLAS
ncbi:MAG: alpha-amylase family glycosyl hydrolase [Deltaproteobacteria bacterium]|nr:alpha-amylase family glycosyl hydrolase [Deltaproteobacteria bacterium]